MEYPLCKHKMNEKRARRHRLRTKKDDIKVKGERAEGITKKTCVWALMTTE